MNHGCVTRVLASHVTTNMYQVYTLQYIPHIAGLLYIVKAWPHPSLLSKYVGLIMKHLLPHYRQTGYTQLLRYGKFHTDTCSELLQLNLGQLARLHIIRAHFISRLQHACLVVDGGCLTELTAIYQWHSTPLASQHCWALNCLPQCCVALSSLHFKEASFTTASFRMVVCVCDSVHASHDADQTTS